MCLDTGDFGLWDQERRDCAVASDLILCFFNIFSVSSLKFGSVGLCLSTLSSTSVVVLSLTFDYYDMCFRAEAIKLIDAKWGDSEVAMALAFSTVCV
jgi:hypothetical protein